MLDWPESLDELVDHTLPLNFITCQSGLQVTERFSILKADVLRVPGNPNFSLISKYKQLNNMVKFYKRSWLNLNLEMYHKNLGKQYKFKHIYNSLINVPETNLVLIDPLVAMQRISRLVKIYIPTNSVSKPKLFPGYILMTPWLVRRTYFFHIFVRKLAQYYESGIWDKLLKHKEIINSYSTLVMFQETISKAAGIRDGFTQASPSRSKIYYFSRYIETRLNGESRALTLTMVFFICLISLICALLLFVLEFLLYRTCI